MSDQTPGHDRFSGWTSTPLGRSLIELENESLSDVLAPLRGEIALQFGANSGTPLLDACNFSYRYIIDDDPGPVLPGSSHEYQYLYANLARLPFAPGSVSMCLLPHVLEFSNQPHEVLREVNRVLASGGYIVILGFNPYSLWGVRKLIASRNGRVIPWSGRYRSMGRIRDWLKLLDFDIDAGTMLYYRPPAGNVSLRGRLGFMEKAGNRWWPLLAAVYLLVAQKNEAGMTVIELNKRFRKIPYLNATEPVARHGERLYG